MFFSWFSDGNGSRTGLEGVKIAFHPCQVYKKVPVCPLNGNQPVGRGDKPSTGTALVSTGAISSNPVWYRKTYQHIIISVMRIKNVIPFSLE